MKNGQKGSGGGGTKRHTLTTVYTPEQSADTSFAAAVFTSSFCRIEAGGLWPGRTRARASVIRLARTQTAANNEETTVMYIRALTITNDRRKETR